MNVLVAIFGLTAAVWALILLRYVPSIATRMLAWGVVAYLVAQVFLGYWFFHVEAGPIAPTIDRAVLGLLLGMWAIRLWQTRGAELRLDWMDVVVFGWFAVISCNTLTHDWKFRNNLPLSRLLFFNLLPLLAYIVMKHTSWRIGDLRIINCAWLLIGLALSLIAIAEWQAWYSVIYPTYIVSPTFEEFFGRGRGPLLNPMINGSLISVGLMATFLMARTAGTTQRIGLGIVAVAMLLGLYCTLTRSVWIAGAAVLAIFVLAWSSWQWRIRLACIGVVCAAMFYVYGAEALNRFKRDQNVTVEQMSESARLRPMLVAVAWEMFKDHPVNGVGFGLYHKYKAPYHFTDKYGWPLQSVLNYTQHNVFLVYMLETGVVGTLFFVAILATVTYRSCRVWSQFARNEQHPELAQFGLVGVAIVSVYVINGMFHDVSIIPMSNCLLLYAAGLVGQLSISEANFSGEKVWNLIADRIEDPRQLSGEKLLPS
jgi:O-antigen ligase